MEYERVTAEVLHVAFQCAIFQQYQWSTKSDPIHYSSGLDITMAAKLLLRDLDFIDAAYSFNDDELHKNYSYRISEDGYGFILEHEGLFRNDKECEEWEKFDSVFLAVSIFVNGVAQKLELSNNYDDPVIVVNSPEFFVVQDHCDSNSDTAAESLTDTPFQLIKLAHYGRLFKLDKDGVFLTELKALATNWIQVLETANVRGFYAFPRPKTDPTTPNEFRLDDHVWMWRALSAVKDMVRGNELGNFKLRSTRRRREASEESFEKVESNLNAEYSPDVFQKHVLRRFTTENPVSKQRMLAVARSPVENRFYLHSRDTASLYKENSTFFSKYDALWKATMNVQRFHEGSEDFGRGNPLRYTLDIMRETIDCIAAKDILLQSSSANGLFPGALDPLTKEPEMSYEGKWRDRYWHRTFEVPYILWECRDSDIFQSVLSKDSAQVQKESINIPVQVQKDLSNVPAHTQRDVSIILSEIQKEFDDALTQGQKDLPASSLASDLYPTQMTMKKRIPFNNVIVQQSIVELSDEWLYRFPSFFHSELSAEDTVPVEDTVKNKNATVIPHGVIIDIPKTDRSKEYEDPLVDVELLDNEDMYNKLRKERSVHNSKKRLVWITNPDTDTKRFCRITSADDESDSLNLFFERHNNKAKYFSDEVTAAANLWTTELHLSSYRLIRQTRNEKRAESTEKLEKMFKLKELKLDFEQQKEPWKQRKVLELLLLDRMLRELTQRYDEIIGEIGQQLERLFVRTARTDSKNTKEEKVKGNIVSISNELFSRQMNNGAYLVFRKTWPALQYSLQVIEEDLKEVLENIDIWNTRKADRRPEEPRWTKNDEGRYRAAITKLTNENLHAIRDLRYHLATIQSLRVSLSSGLDSTRDELSFQNAENIRYFTFLTAVFLPLGFATGIWSMADSSPRSESIRGMVVTAVITLFLTFTVLINVQRLNEYLSLYTSRTFWEKHNGAQANVHQEQQGDPSERDSAIAQRISSVNFEGFSCLV
ncbi:hypothetical protein AA0111_g12816 [Alternaria arborescens]|uniref:hypothetical protein n=1 Tax=Alternaria arborescens TaxID=156630 RepID=UPI00107500FE|nr:hypothetical protein AA0111_g12816 [Alternaria arborescens]RYO11399.1 hypothetical protein AA0111_g12816 [Alternaria arborescens]